MLVDTHCHLNFEAFDDDRQAVLERARQAGVERILNPGIDLPSSRAAVQLAERYPQVYAAVGVHPNEALSWTDETLQELRELAKHPKVVAIGEIGLDYYRDRAPQDEQRAIFSRQLLLAAEFDKPVIIHNREATEDVLKILTDWQMELVGGSPLLAQLPGVLHSFSYGEDAAREALRLNFFLGFTGPVTFRNAPDLQKLVSDLPLEKVLVETDAPFLTPHPHRGKRNEPAYVRLVAEKIAELHGLPFEIVANITSENAERLFRWQITE